MSNSFHDERFPTGISLKSTGGPQRQTQIVTLSSGHEQRNTRWADSRRHYNAGYGTRSLDDIHAVLEFFEQRSGKLYGFRWKDHADYKSCLPSKTPDSQDQKIGQGDGTEITFQLAKTYGSGTTSYQRTISLPVDETLAIAIDNVEQAETTDYSIDYATGIVTFVSAPATGAAITAGFEFDVPVRFDTDSIEINLAAFDAGQIPDIAIVEIK